MILVACLMMTVLATEPNAATKRWWAHTQALANDSMQGRDTGSEAYDRAAAYVAREFQRVGVKPAGTLGYFQQVPMRRVRLVAADSSAEISGKRVEFYKTLNVAVRMGMPTAFDAPLMFLGTEALAGAVPEGVITVGLGAPRLVKGQRPYTSEVPKEAVATLTIPSTKGPEPQRWPVAYSVSVTLDGEKSGAVGRGLPAFTMNPVAAESLFEGSGHTFAEVLALADSGAAIPSFPLKTRLKVNLKLANEFIASDNILGVLPGTDPKLASEYVVVSAHLDGYGPGEPWNGDGIYNGAFDDAAYVATLLDFAEHLQETHRTLKRSILFCVFTGEEKGLLGSKYFVAHLPYIFQRAVAAKAMVADVNLDQLRPIFPLKIMTALALEESTLGLTARKVAEGMGIQVRQDLEPERGLLRRSDHYNFMQIGVPSMGFLFGYDKGTPEEATFRKWYVERYHSPADDLNQPWVPEAAAKFNTFFAKFVETLADAADRPAWSPGSTFAGK